MKIELFQKHRCLRVPTRFAEYLRAVASEWGKGVTGKINVILTDDARIRELNRDFLGKDRVTDVIAFNYGDDGVPDPERVYGEVYVSADRAREQAKDYGHSFSREVLILFLHGLLHLFGGRDDTPAGAQEMRAKVDSAISRLEPAVTKNKGGR